jgi:hypothetical protein
MSDEPTVEELNSTIKVMEARIYALIADINGEKAKNIEANDQIIGMKAQINKCYDQQKVRIAECGEYKMKWQKASLERDAIEEDLTRFKNLIDFLQRYVLDEI